VGRLKALRSKSEQKLFLVFLEMPNGGTRHVNVKASSSEVAGKRAMKRVSGAVKVHRVEKGI
jgi:hypothetical protein